MKFLICLLLLSTSAFANEKNGVIVVPSKHSFETTVSNVESLLKKKGFTIFAVIDHAKNAKKAGLELSPNTLIIFGNPQVGTPLMQKSASAGLDLPVKIQITAVEKVTSISYNDPAYIAQRHNLSVDLPQIKKMTQVLSWVAKSASD